MLSWLDVRSVHQADRLMEGDIPARLFQYTGNIPTAKDVIPKILWLKEERPDIWQRTAYLFDCKEYLVYKLTGKVATDWVGASAYFLFDPYKKVWSQEACRLLGIDQEKLPPAYPCTQVIGEVTEEAARLTGLLARYPGGERRRRCLRRPIRRRRQPHRQGPSVYWHRHLGRHLHSTSSRTTPIKPFWGLSHIHPQKWVIAGEMETGGGALMWFRDTLCQEEVRQAAERSASTYALINDLAAPIPPGSDRLFFLPWLSGERAPVLDHYARGGFVGLSMGHTKGHFARAVMEGVGYHIRWICEAMEAWASTIDAFNAIGGGCSSPLWWQSLANVDGPGAAW